MNQREKILGGNKRKLYTCIPVLLYVFCLRHGQYGECDAEKKKKTLPRFSSSAKSWRKPLYHGGGQTTPITDERLRLKLFSFFHTLFSGARLSIKKNSPACAYHHHRWFACFFGGKKDKIYKVWELLEVYSKSM